MSARLHLLSSSLAAMALACGLAFAPPETPQAAFRGHDRFDEVQSLEDLRALERDVVEVAARVRPSVVYLRQPGPSGGATGTAVVISKDGLLATCGHVGRRPGRELIAVFADGTEIRGRTLGQVLSHGVDCGLVQLETEGRELPAVPLGTTAGLAKGDWLVALGYTQGLAGAVRPSLVRCGRVLYVGENELYFDAPIDAGDSGGPSFNLRGEVVGLNARCGRPSWQNIATNIDRLSERLETLKAQVEAKDQPTDAVDSDRAHGGAGFGGGFQASDEGGKSDLDRSAPLGAIAAGAEAATVRVHCDGRGVAYGTVIDARGLVVTKASQLETGKAIEVEIAGGARRAAREIARDAAADVALLRIALDAGTEGDVRLAAVSWAVDAAPQPGAVLVTPRGFGRGATLGFAAIEERESEADQVDGPYLGVQTRAASKEELEQAAADRGVTVIRVMPGTPAERAGLKVGQMLLSVNDAEVGSPIELRSALRKHAVGETVRLKRVEGEAATELEVALARREGPQGGLRRGNTATPISRRSSGFGSLLPHDTITLPEEMGGPVVDLDGRVIGMNIARFDRTATHAIGAARMEELCQRLLEQASASGQ